MILQTLATLGAIALALTALGFLLHFAGDARDRRRLPPPGERIQVQGATLHIQRQGTGDPLVLFDSALGSTSLSWSLIQDRIAQQCATLSFDRPGSGWSDSIDGPVTAERLSRLLAGVLETIDHTGPVLLVGHSYGGLTARYFAAHHPDKVAAMVLIEPADDQQWIQLKPNDLRKIVGGARLSRRGVWVARLGVARLVIWLGSSGAVGAARRAAGFLSNGVPRPIQNRLLAPIEKLPPDARRALRWFWARPSFYASLAEQIAGVPESAKQVADAPLLGSLPLTVISASSQSSSWQKSQQRIASTSRQGRHIIAENSSHWIPVDRPDLIVAEIEKLIEKTKPPVQ